MQHFSTTPRPSTHPWATRRCTGTKRSRSCRTIAAMLEDLNKAAKKAGLHVAHAKKDGLYSIRKTKNAKLIAKNVDADQAASIIADHA